MPHLKCIFRTAALLASALPTAAAISQTSAPSSLATHAYLDGDEAEAALAAAFLWRKGDPAKVADAYGQIRFEPSLFGTWTNANRQILFDWIVALVWSDPAAAAAKLDDWRKQDTHDGATFWHARQLQLSAQIQLATGKLTEARGAVELARTAVDVAIADIDAAMVKMKRQDRWQAQNNRDRLAVVRREIRRSEFLVAAHERGDSAFSEFSEPDVNPFITHTGSLFLTTFKPVVCGEHDLTESDWAIFDVSLVKQLKQTEQILVRPIAASRFAAIKPYLEGASGWLVTVRRAG